MGGCSACRRDRAGWRGYCGGMRYPDGGGLSAAGRVRREKVRLQAAEWFAEGVTPPEVARRLRVSSNSAYVWRRRWRAGGEAALASGGPGGAVCRLSGAQLERLRAALAGRPGGMGMGRGPAVDAGPGHHLDGRAVPCPVHAAGHLVPAAPPRVHPADAGAPGRGAGRGEDRRLAEPDVGEGTRLAAATGAWIVFGDEAGQNLRPPKARTWAPRGHTPVVKVCGKGSGRVSVAGLVCLKPGARGHLFSGSASTVAARASAARCPKTTTPA